jgi:hypothetical protein
MTGSETRRVEVEIVGRATIPMIKITVCSSIRYSSFERILVKELLVEED